jgi:hypothetical protein
MRQEKARRTTIHRLTRYDMGRIEEAVSSAGVEMAVAERLSFGYAKCLQEVPSSKVCSLISDIIAVGKVKAERLERERLEAEHAEFERACEEERKRTNEKRRQDEERAKVRAIREERKQRGNRAKKAAKHRRLRKVGEL